MARDNLSSEGMSWVEAAVAWTMLLLVAYAAFKVITGVS